MRYTDDYTPADAAADLFADMLAASVEGGNRCDGSGVLWLECVTPHGDRGTWCGGDDCNGAAGDCPGCENCATTGNGPVDNPYREAVAADYCGGHDMFRPCVWCGDVAP